MLTTQQRQTLLTAVKAIPVAEAFRIAGDAFSLRAWCNSPRTPEALAWRTAVTANDLVNALTFTSYDSVTGGKRDAFRLMLEYGPIDASRGAVRNGLADIFAVTGSYTDAQQAGRILGACTEPATNAQFALGGNTPASVAGVSALRRNFAELVDDEDVSWLIASP